MYCVNCGKEIPDDSNVCMYCGYRLNDVNGMDSPPAGYSPMYEPAYIQKPQPKMKRLTKLVISLIIICAVIVTGELSYLYINSSGTGHSSITSRFTGHNATANAVITYDTDGSINELLDIQNKKPHKLKIFKDGGTGVYSPDGRYFYYSGNGFRRIRISEIGKNYSLNAKKSTLIDDKVDNLYLSGDNHILYSKDDQLYTASLTDDAKSVSPKKISTLSRVGVFFKTDDYVICLTEPDNKELFDSEWGNIVKVTADGKLETVAKDAGIDFSYYIGKDGFWYTTYRSSSGSDIYDLYYFDATSGKGKKVQSDVGTDKIKLFHSIALFTENGTDSYHISVNGSSPEPFDDYDENSYFFVDSQNKSAVYIDCSPSYDLEDLPNYELVGYTITSDGLANKQKLTETGYPMVKRNEHGKGDYDGRDGFYFLNDYDSDTSKGTLTCWDGTNTSQVINSCPSSLSFRKVSENRYIGCIDNVIYITGSGGNLTKIAKLDDYIYGLIITRQGQILYLTSKNNLYRINKNQTHPEKIASGIAGFEAYKGKELFTPGEFHVDPDYYS